MRIEVKYRLFKTVGETMVAANNDSYQIINVDGHIDIDSPEGFETIKTELSNVLGIPKTNFKILNGSLV